MKTNDPSRHPLFLTQHTTSRPHFPPTQLHEHKVPAVLKGVLTLLVTYEPPVERFDTAAMQVCRRFEARSCGFRAVFVSQAAQSTTPV